MPSSTQTTISGCPLTRNSRQSAPLSSVCRSYGRTLPPQKTVLSSPARSSAGGDALIPDFTLAVRVVTDTSTRLARIKQREYARFGARILPGGDMYDQHQAFLQWAAGYDDGGLDTRSAVLHNEWQKQLACPILTVDGTAPLAETAVRVEELLCSAN